MYALYKGEDDEKYIDILEGLYKKGGSDAFYAALYLGLYYEARSHADSSRSEFLGHFLGHDMAMTMDLEAKADVESAKLWLLRSVDSKYGRSSPVAASEVLKGGWT